MVEGGEGVGMVEGREGEARGEVGFVEGGEGQGGRGRVCGRGRRSGGDGRGRGRVCGRGRRSGGMAEEGEGGEQGEITSSDDEPETPLGKRKHAPECEFLPTPVRRKLLTEDPVIATAFVGDTSHISDVCRPDELHKQVQFTWLQWTIKNGSRRGN